MTRQALHQAFLEHPRLYRVALICLAAGLGSYLGSLA